MFLKRFIYIIKIINKTTFSSAHEGYIDMMIDRHNGPVSIDHKVKIAINFIFVKSAWIISIFKFRYVKKNGYWIK